MAIVGKDKGLELLAPAGSWEALEAAINSGADAVYLGGKRFGARAFADNFDDEQLARAVKLAHLHGVKLFVTVNTLVSDAELHDASKHLIYLHDIGVDAIIVQDMGIVRLASAVVPDLPIHASTQMTITSSPAVRFVKQYGIVRAVPARELSLTDLKAVCSEGIEIEAFIHGALCVCYSGQCLMSSIIGGRSGNRGECAQPCRMPYSLEDSHGKKLTSHAGQYLLSPKDMNTLKILPELIAAGVCSFKIEGRMKRPEYVAVVTAAYRRAIDSLRSDKKYSISDSDKTSVAQIFSRGFTTGYLLGHQGRDMISDDRPNNHGLSIGHVERVRAKRGSIKLEERLSEGDMLEIAKGREYISFPAANLQIKGKQVQYVPLGISVELDFPFTPKQGAQIFKVTDMKLLESAQKFYGDKNKKRIPIDAHVTAKLGEILEITFTDKNGIIGHGKTVAVAQKAKTRPMDLELLRKQLNRLGTTEYALDSLTADIDKDIMMPASEINEARRHAIAQLDKARLDAFMPKRTHISKRSVIEFLDAHGIKSKESIYASSTNALLSVWVDTPQKAQAALAGGADWIIYGGDVFSTKKDVFDDFPSTVKLVHSHHKKIAVSTPRIVAEGQIPYVAQTLLDAVRSGADQINIHNLSTWQLAKEKTIDIPLWADMSLNIYNSQSLKFWQEHGAWGATPSIELTLAQLKHMRKFSPLPLECLVHGAIEMMVSEYCAAGSFLGNAGRHKCAFACQEKTWLKDRKGARFQTVGDQFCRMHILNSQALCMLNDIPKILDSGIDRLRIDARSYDSRTCAHITSLYRDSLDDKPSQNLPNTTRGHYFRGV